MSGPTSLDPQAVGRLNVVSQLRMRETHNNGDCYRRCNRILAKVVQTESRSFKHTSTHVSQEFISCESDLIYLKPKGKVSPGDARKVVTVREGKTVGDIKLRLGEKITNGIMWNVPVSDCSEIGVNHLFAMVTKNRLVVTNCDTGKEVRSIMLPSAYSFKKVFWNDEYHSFYLTTSSSETTWGFAFVFVDVLPLKVTSVLFFKKTLASSTTPVNDCTIKSVSLLQDILIIQYQHVQEKRKFTTVELYSLTMLLEQNQVKTTPVVPEDTCLPVDLSITKISQLPPYLFRFECDTDCLDFGGFPLHCLTWHKSKYFLHQLNRSVRPAEYVNPIGHVEVFKEADADERNIYFHSSFDGAMVNISESKYQLLKLKPNGNGSYLAEPLVDLKLSDLFPREDITDSGSSNGFVFTSSGRPKRPPTRYGEFEAALTRRIEDLSYDESLEFSVLIVLTASPDGSGDETAQLVYTDCWSGKVVKRVPLRGKWDSTGRNFVQASQDHIVHIEQADKGANRFRCHVYQLSGDQV